MPLRSSPSRAESLLFCCRCFAAGVGCVTLDLRDGFAFDRCFGGLFGFFEDAEDAAAREAADLRAQVNALQQRLRESHTKQADTENQLAQVKVGRLLCCAELLSVRTGVRPVRSSHCL